MILSAMTLLWDTIGNPVNRLPSPTKELAVTDDAFNVVADKIPTVATPTFRFPFAFKTCPVGIVAPKVSSGGPSSNLSTIELTFIFDISLRY